jgi:hypothetical protein
MIGVQLAFAPLELLRDTNLSFKNVFDEAITSFGGE